jgi:HSP20 family protein
MVELSSGDEWFKRWGKMVPSGPWSYSDVDEMMREMEKEFMEFKNIDVPKELIKEKRAEDGSVIKEIGPIVYGYSVTVGPDGKPDIREFGNVRGSSKKLLEALTDTREPLVDIVDDKKEIRLIAELPGVKKEDVEVTVKGKSLTVSAENSTRKYRKELELKSLVDLGKSKSTFNNGILEVTLPKRKGKRSGVRIKVD